jgi:hypothetical protein
VDAGRSLGCGTIVATRAAMNRCFTAIPLFLLAVPALAQQPLNLPRGTVLSGGAVYDSARQRVVVSLSGHSLLELGSNGWLQRAGWPVVINAQWPLPASVLVEPQLVYDPGNRRTLVLAGWSGSDFVTMAYDGSRMTAFGPGGGPPWRSLAALGFDAARGQTLLFGGFDAVAGDLSDTWTFDGVVWTQHQPVVTPPARSATAICYDSVRQKMVVFGGWSSGQSRNDTWEWDGTAWFASTPNNSPAPRYWAGMAFDPLRNRTVLAGGRDANSIHDDVWEYDGTQWTLARLHQPEAARYEHVMVFDEALGRVRILGGLDSVSNVASTSSYDGQQFRAEIPMQFGPYRRLGSAVCAEPGRAASLLFGGDAGYPYAVRDDLWRFDGRSWQPLGAAGPSPRSRAVMAPLGSDVILFGGADSAGVALGDTWRWNGVAWSPVITSSAPSPRWSAGLAPSNGAAQLLLFGGEQTSAVFGDTWLFNGVQWVQQATTAAPSARANHALGYDQARNRAVLFGGYGAGSWFADTWEWNGTSWNQVLAATPPAVVDPSMDFDSQRGRLILGGRRYTGTFAATYQQFYDFDGSAWSAVGSSLGDTSAPHVVGAPSTVGTTILSAEDATMLPVAWPGVVAYGTACSVDAPRLIGSTLPRISTPQFGIEVVGAPANQFVGLLAAFASASIPVGGCTLLVQPGQAAVLLSTNAGGFAAQALPLPNALSLLGVALFAQAVALSNNAPGFTLSEGLRLTIGG